MEISEQRKKLVLWTCLFGNFLASCVYSLQAPFLPAEAEKKGVTPTEYGIIFSIYELVVLLASPFVGTKLPTLGPKFCFCSGLILTGSCCSLFGFLNWCPGPFKFLVLAYSLRIVEGFGQCLFVISALAIISATFPDTANAKLSIMSTVFMIGSILSPSIGGFLYSLGGFGLPFHVIGILIVMGATVAMFTMPSFDSDRKGSGSDVFMNIGKSPLFWLVVLALVTVAVSFGFLQSTLEPHIRVFNYSKVYVSLFFVVGPCAQGLSTRFVGHFLDNGYSPRMFALIGAVFMIISFFLVGPLPFIPVAPNPYLVVAGLVFNGLAISCSCLSGFAELLKVTKIFHFDQDETTTGVVSSVWQASISFGIMIGPFLGGVFLQYTGFRLGILFPIALNVFVIIMTGLSLLKSNGNRN